MTANPPRAAVATIVAANAVDKLAALQIIADAVGSFVKGAGTSQPAIPLAEGVWIRIEIPKFGEPPPLAIDVHAAGGTERARSEALALMERLRERTPWLLSPTFADGVPPSHAT